MAWRSSSALFLFTTVLLCSQSHAAQVNAIYSSLEQTSSSCCADCDKVLESMRSTLREVQQGGNPQAAEDHKTDDINKSVPFSPPRSMTGSEAAKFAGAAFVGAGLNNGQPWARLKPGSTCVWLRRRVASRLKPRCVSHISPAAPNSDGAPLIHPKPVCTM